MTISKKGRKQAKRGKYKKAIKTTRRMKGGILAINEQKRTFKGKRYNTNIAYTNRRRALREAKALRKAGKYDAKVKPYARSKDKTKYHAVYTHKRRKKGN